MIQTIHIGEERLELFPILHKDLMLPSFYIPIRIVKGRRSVLINSEYYLYILLVWIDIYCRVDMLEV